MGFQKRSISKRSNKPTKSQIKKKLKEEKLKNIKQWKESLYKISEKESVFSEINININGMEEFFNKISFKTNIIHIIRGDNGQGKSTFLKNIANSTMRNIFEHLENKMKIGSNNSEIGKLFNGNEMNPYVMYEDNSIFSQCKFKNHSNLKHNLTIYTDFSIEFYKKASHSILMDIEENYNNNSNGERKINGINDIFGILKIIKELEIDKIVNGLNIIVIMDEPESGLSLNIQKELRKKLMFYIGKMSDKVSLTFFIASHSFVWQDNKYIKTYDINDFKNLKNRKKEHKRVFI
jgi:predicted ATPase